MSDQALDQATPADDADAEGAILALILVLEAMAAAAAQRWQRHVSGSIGRLISQAARSGETFDSAALIRLRRLLRAEAAGLPADLAGDLDTLIADAIDATESATRRAIRAMQGSGAYQPLSDDDIATLAAGEFDGRSWQEWAHHTSTGMMTTVDSKLAVMAAGSAAVVAVITALSGMEARMGARTGMLAHSAAIDTSQRALLASLSRNNVQAVRFSAVLDGRTSDICRSLHGRVWRVGDPGIRRPPLHPYCRSTLVPVVA